MSTEERDGHVGREEGSATSEDASERARRDTRRLRDELREMIRLAPESPRVLEQELGMSKLYIPKALAASHRLRVELVYQLLHGLDEDPASFFQRVHGGSPPRADAFLYSQARPCFQTWPKHRTFVSIARTLNKTPDSTAGPPPFAEPKLTEEIHRLTRHRRHYRRVRMRNTKSLKHPAFVLQLCEHLEELRYDAPSEAAAIAEDIVETIVREAPGALDERRTLFVTTLGVLGSALRQLRKLDQSAFVFFLALQVARGAGEKAWIGRLLQRSMYLAVDLEAEAWAEVMLAEAAAQYKRIGDVAGLARVRVDQAYVELRREEYDAVILSVLEALRLFSDHNISDQRNHAAAFQYLSIANSALDDEERAVETLEQALLLAGNGTALNRAKLLVSRAELLSKIGQHLESARAFQEAATVFELCEATSFQTYALIGRIHETCLATGEIPDGAVSLVYPVIMKLDADNPVAEAAARVIRHHRSGTLDIEIVAEAVKACQFDRAPENRAHDRGKRN